jgi:hypothetical protein
MTKFGRPLKFKSVEELETKIDEYFRSCYDYARDMWGNRLKDKEANVEAGESQWVMKKVKQFTISGMALYIGTSRETLMDYEKGKYDGRDEEGNAVELTEEEKIYNQQVDDFSDTIKKAKLACYADTEESLFVPGKATGAIFSLKNNYDWKDKSEQQITSPDGSLPVVRIIDERQPSDDIKKK